MSGSERSRLFSALLKYWRRRRGLSQLDLALHADISARHISFLETGRSKPSAGMVLRLATALDVPLREQNEMLRASGFEEVYAETELSELADAGVQRVIAGMLSKHEPYPMTVIGAHYDVVRMNRGAQSMLGHFIADPAALTTPLNVMQALFDPRLCRPFVQDWESIARMMLTRLQCESLHAPRTLRSEELMKTLLSFPGVPTSWQQPDFSMGLEPTVHFVLERDELRLSFLTTLTAFAAPRHVALQEVRIESYFPADERTATACQRLAAST